MQANRIVNTKCGKRKPAWVGDLRPGIGRIRGPMIECGLCRGVAYAPRANLDAWRTTRRHGVCHTRCFRAWRRWRAER